MSNTYHTIIIRHIYLILCVLPRQDVATNGTLEIRILCKTEPSLPVPVRLFIDTSSLSTLFVLLCPYVLWFSDYPKLVSSSEILVVSSFFSSHFYYNFFVAHMLCSFSRSTSPQVSSSYDEEIVPHSLLSRSIVIT